MEETLKINVKLSLEDAKDAHYSQLYEGYPIKKPNIYSSIRFGIITCLNIFIILGYFICSVARLFFGYPIFVRGGISLYLFILLIINFTSGKRYLAWLLYPWVKSSHKKNKLSSIPTQYEFSDHNFKLKSKIDNYTYEWNVIHQIEEWPMHFIIYVHRGIGFILPKRFFKNKAELYKFIEIIKKNVAPSKLKLKDYLMDERYFNQEVIDILDDEIVGKEAKDGHQKPFEYLSYGLDESIRFKIALAIYFQLSSMRIFSYIGISFFLLWLPNIIAFNTSSILEKIILTLFCGVFTFFVPFELIRNNLKNLREIDQGRGYCVGYNEDKIFIDWLEGSTQLEWNQLYKVKEYKLFFMINISPTKVIPIPKSIFDSEPEKLKQLKEIISSKCK